MEMFRSFNRQWTYSSHEIPCANIWPYLATGRFLWQTFLLWTHFQFLLFRSRVAMSTQPYENGIFQRSKSIKCKLTNARLMDTNEFLFGSIKIQIQWNACADTIKVCLCVTAAKRIRNVDLFTNKIKQLLPSQHRIWYHHRVERVKCHPVYMCWLRVAKIDTHIIVNHCHHSLKWLCRPIELRATHKCIGINFNNISAKVSKCICCHFNTLHLSIDYSVIVSRSIVWKWCDMTHFTRFISSFASLSLAHIHKQSNWFYFNFLTTVLYFLPTSPTSLHNYVESMLRFCDLLRALVQSN